MADLKYYIFFFTLFIIAPATGVVGGYYKKLSNFIFGLSIFFTCRLSESINFVSHEFYRGTSRGFEITLVDCLCISLFIISIFRNKFKDIVFFPPGSTLMVMYFIFSMMSIINAANITYSLFELFKMIRMYFVYWVFYNYINSLDDIKVFFKSMSIVICYIFISVLWDKYIGGRYQARGPFPHQNSLVMYMQIFAGISFAHFFNSRKFAFKWGWLSAISTMLIIMTLSRGGLLCYAISISIIYFLSIINNFSKQKVILTLYMLMALFGIGLKSIGTLYERFTTAPKESAHTRVYLAKSAVNMANDKFFGIGLNNFGVKVNKPFLYSKDSPRYEEKGFKEGLVETSYLMIAAETGWLNLLVFLILLSSFYYRNIRMLIKYRKNNYYPLLLGVFGGLTAIYVESSLERVLKQTTNSYQLILVFSILSVLYTKKILDEPVVNTKEAI